MTNSSHAGSKHQPINQSNKQTIKLSHNVAKLFTQRPAASFSEAIVQCRILRRGKTLTGNLIMGPWKEQTRPRPWNLPQSRSPPG